MQRSMYFFALLIVIAVLLACATPVAFNAPSPTPNASPTALVNPSASTSPTRLPAPRATLTLTPAPTSVTKSAFSPAGTWVERGPNGSGRITGLVATDVNHLWAASPGGGVWKSADGGATWEWAGNRGLTDYTVLDLALDRNDPTRMFLQTWNGFWVSIDGAASWKRTLAGQRGGGDASHFLPSWMCGVFPHCPPFTDSSINEPQPFTQIVFSKTQSVLLTALPCSGLQYSTDSGTSFTQLAPFRDSNPETNPDNCILSIAADEATGYVYFGTLASSLTDKTHIWRSTEPWTAKGPAPSSGWQLVNNGLPLAHATIGLAWGGSPNKVMALLRDQSGAGWVPYLFDGTVWTAKRFNNPDCIFRDARFMVWGGGNDFFAGGVWFAYSPNAGDTWVCPVLNNQHADIRSIFIDHASHHVWIGADQSSLATQFVIVRFPWTPGSKLGEPTGLKGTGISTWQTFSAGISPSAATRKRIIAGAIDVGSACSDDGGATWHLIPTDEAQSIVWSRSGSGNVVYAFSSLLTMQRSDNAASAANCEGIKFKDVSPPDSLRASNAYVGPHTIAVHPKDANRVLIALARQLVFSPDGGAKWSAFEFPLAKASPSAAAATVFVDEDGMTYVGTQDGGAFICKDAIHFCDGSAGAGTWTPWGLNAEPSVTPPRMILAIAESNPPPAPRTFWMATTNGLYRKLPTVANWELVDPTPDFVFSDVAIDPTCRTRIYAGIGYFSIQSRTRGGIDLSTDNGQTWSMLADGAPLDNIPITQIIIDSANPQRVLATTYGRGVWEYQWGSALPPCKPSSGLADAWAHPSFGRPHGKTKGDYPL